MATLQERATAAGGWFERKKRGEELIWVARNGAPEWVRDMCHAAHQDGSNGGMMPDNWRYSFIVEALDALSEADEPDHIELDADIYTSELTAWLGSRNDRSGYCDQAADEYGIDPEADVIRHQPPLHLRLMWGQKYEKHEVLTAVREYLETSDGWGDDDDE